MVLGGWLFLMSEVPLYRQRFTYMSSKIPACELAWVHKLGFSVFAFVSVM